MKGKFRRIVSFVLAVFLVIGNTFSGSNMVIFASSGDDDITISKTKQTGFEFSNEIYEFDTNDTSAVVEAAGGESSGKVIYSVETGGDIVSSVSETGALTFTGNEGTAKIKAVKEGDDNYEQAEAICTVNVSSKSSTPNQSDVIPPVIDVKLNGIYQTTDGTIYYKEAAPSLTVTVTDNSAVDMDDGISNVTCYG